MEYTVNMKTKITYQDNLLSHLTTPLTTDDDEISKSTPHLKSALPAIRVTEFDSYSLGCFIKRFNQYVDLGVPVIPVTIDSYGGEVYSLLGMIDVIESSSVPVLTYSTSKSMSCGAFLAAFGTKGYRYISPLSTIMIHSISGFDWGKLEDMKSNVKEMDRLTDIVFGKLDEVCGQEQHFFKALIKENLNADFYVGAEDCKKYGLVDHIGVPDIEISFDITSKFKVRQKE